MADEFDFLDAPEPDPTFDLDQAPPEIEESIVIEKSNAILREAIARGATAVHFEPTAEETRVLFRIDGSLREHDRLPRSERRGVATRLKIMAYVDITERRRPQSGVMHLRSGGRRAEFLLSAVPTVHGEERIVLRTKPGAEAVRPFRDSGLGRKVVDSWLAGLEAREGLYLISGKAKTGKTHALYSTLLALREQGSVILTAESSVQVRLDGINQTQLVPSMGLSAAGLARAFLAQDADVFAIDGLSSAEAAEAALEVAVKGHRVFATIHTPGATEALTRLADMGLERYAVSDVIRAVLGLRMVRRLCKECRKPDPLSPEARTRYGLGAGGVYKAGGCPPCGGTGYRGRLLLGELLLPDDEVRRAFNRGDDPRTFAALARKRGMVPLYEAAMAKVAEGETSLAEVLSVLAPPSQGE